VTDSNDRDARQDINELLVRYASAIDNRDWDLLRTCFTPDCHADYAGIGTWDGVDAITEFMVAAHAGLGHTLHRISNAAITVSGDRASARAYVDVVAMSPDGDTGLTSIGWYDDELVRTEGHWRIARRRLTPVHMGTLS
jgi:3-phenylpropionate/cinnamic acid dioxygenase small subunit